jgi:hypothetical protein
LIRILLALAILVTAALPAVGETTLTREVGKFRDRGRPAPVPLLPERPALIPIPIPENLWTPPPDLVWPAPTEPAERPPAPAPTEALPAARVEPAPPVASAPTPPAPKVAPVSVPKAATPSKARPKAPRPAAKIESRTRTAAPAVNDGSTLYPCPLICGNMAGKTIAQLMADRAYYNPTPRQMAHGKACVLNTCPGSMRPEVLAWLRRGR